MSTTMTDLEKKVWELAITTIEFNGIKQTRGEWVSRSKVLSLIAEAQKPVVWTEIEPGVWQCQCKGPSIRFDDKPSDPDLGCRFCSACSHPIGEFREYDD